MTNQKAISRVRYITYTAVILALTVVFQMFRTIFPFLEAVGIGNTNLSVLIIGTLVNLCLIIASWKVGFWSGAAVSVLSVVIAFAQGHLPSALPQMMAAVALGNLTIVAAVWLIGKKNRAASVVIGAVLKFAVLFAAVRWIVIPVWVNLDYLGKEALVAKLTAALSANFSWPQLVTALAGGALALLMWPRIAQSETTSGVQDEQ